MRVGVIIFDNEKSIDAGGWASEAGRESYRIAGIHHIDNNVIWLTNIGFKEFKDMELSKVSYLRESHYLRIKINSLINELGVRHNASESAQVLSKIFHRVAKFGNQAFGVDVNDFAYRYPNLLSDKIIPPEMKKSPSNNGETIISNLKNATQLIQNSIKSGPSPQNKTPVTITIPRVAYNNYLLSLMYPDDREWSPVKFKEGGFDVGVDKKGNAIEGTKTRMAKLKTLSADNAFIFNVEVLSYEEEYSKFAMFGVGSNETRKWATYPEIVEMVKYCHLSIKKALKTSIGKLDHDLVDRNPSINFSYSKGIYLENLVNALCLPIDRTIYNGVIPYIKSYDRAACFRLAEVFHKENYQIMSYGSGSVVLLVSNNQRDKEEFIGQCLSLGVMPPISMLSALNPNVVELEEEVITDWMPDGLSSFVKEDWLMEFIRAVAPNGLLDYKLIMEIDDVAELPVSEMGPAIDKIVSKIVSADAKQEEEGYKMKDNNDTIDFDEDAEEIDI